MRRKKHICYSTNLQQIHCWIWQLYFLKVYRFSSNFYQIYFIYHLSNLLHNTFPAICFIALQSVDVIYFTLFPSIKLIKFYFVIRLILYLLFLFLLQSQIQKVTPSELIGLLWILDMFEMFYIFHSWKSER